MSIMANSTYTNTGPFCAPYWQPAAILYYDYITPSSYLLGGILMLPVIYLFVKSYLNGSLKTQKSHFCAVIFFFIDILVTYILIVIWCRYECHNGDIANYLHFIAAMFYNIQTLMLLKLLFYRLYKTYNGTRLRLSLTTIRLFIILDIITSIAFVFGGIMYSLFRDGIGGQIWSLASIMVIGETCILLLMFLYKMYTIYKNSKDIDLVKIITKTSLLALVSTLISILVFISFYFIGIFLTAHYNYMVDVLLVCDMYTNALCIFLSYKKFNGYYVKLCGCGDSKCQRCWMSCVKNQELELSVKQGIELTTSTTEATDIDTKTTTNESSEGDGHEQAISKDPGTPPSIHPEIEVVNSNTECE